MRTKSAIASFIGRAGGATSRALGLGGGTSLPGAIALKLDPGLIRELASQLDQGSVIITATNGKTTAANMTAKILSAASLTPIHNAAGANLAYGVATALMNDAEGLKGSKIGLFEVDEAVVKNVVEDLDPKVMAVGNIFRDQLDRFGEVDQTAKLIADGIRLLKSDARLVLNADDPRVAALGKDARVEPVYFGIEDIDHQKGGEVGAQDSKDCLVCGGPLTYSKRYFSHLGDYSCPKCGFKRPRPQITATDLKLTLEASRFTLKTPAGEYKVELGVPAIYNVYNAILAISIGFTVDVDPATSIAALADFQPTFGRLEKIEVEGKHVRLMLIKNPTGFNQAIETLNLDPDPKNIIIAINDNLADGTDVSWLWDTDVERMGKTKALITSGIRAHDMALRLKYSGNKSDIQVEPKLSEALAAGLERTRAGGDLYILPTYTAMLDIRRHLEKMGGAAAFWQPGDRR